MQRKLPSRLLLATLATGLAGVTGQVAAQEFTISANVTNAVEITQNTGLNFGNLFATVTTPTGGGGTPLPNTSSTISITPQGAVTAEATGGSAAVIYLGGATAGNYTIPNLPIGSAVRIEVQDSNGEAIDNATGTAATLTCSYDTAQDAIADKKIVLTAGGPGNGNFSAFFCVDRFTARIGTTDLTSLIQQGTTPGTGYTVPGASLGNVVFSLGASLVAQSHTDTTVTSFEEGLYSGTFNMEVQF